MSEDLEKRVEELEEIVREQQETIERLKSGRDEGKEGSESGKDMSRRRFLKKIGASAAGIGALSLAPAASQLKLTKNGISSSSGFNFLDSGSEYFKLNSGGPIEIQNTDLRIPTGKSIQDDGGDDRILIGSNKTTFYSQSGNRRFVAEDGATKLVANTNSPFQLIDDEGAYTAIQYDTDTNKGVLRMPNAGMRVGANAQPTSGSGLELTYDGTTGRMLAFDRTNTVYKNAKTLGNDVELASKSGLVDMSGDPANLRIATGQMIEDGSGSRRVEMHSNATYIGDETGKANILINDGNYTRFDARSGTPVRIMDREGGFTALQYTTSSSSPGSLELNNSNINIRHNSPWFKVAVGISGYSNNGGIMWADQGGGSNPNIGCTGTGELRAFDDTGNETYLT